jgi:hypothetical protein
VSWCRKRHDEVRGASDLAEDNVLSVEPGGGNGGDEELAAVGVGACGLERGWRVNIFPQASDWKRTAMGSKAHQRWPWTGGMARCAGT